MKIRLFRDITGQLHLVFKATFQCIDYIADWRASQKTNFLSLGTVPLPPGYAFDEKDAICQRRYVEANHLCEYDIALEFNSHLCILFAASTHRLRLHVNLVRKIKKLLRNF